MKKIKTALESILKKDKNYNIYTKFLFFVAIFTSVRFMYPAMFGMINTSFPDWVNLSIATIWFLICLILLPYIFYHIGILPYRIISNLYEKGNSIGSLLKMESKKAGNTENILIQTQLLYKKLKKIIVLRKVCWWFLRRESNKALDIYFELIQIQAYNLLINLRSDLTLRLTEQQQTLEQAKADVSTHIHWTNELNQVSGLQQARLDKQIEQFEELQRVLLKV